MPSQKNTEQLGVIKDQLDKAAAVFFVDYQGLTHQQLEELRKALRSANSEIAIQKNTLLNIALQDKKIDVKDRLTGPKGALYVYEDVIAAAKVLKDFSKKYELPKIEFGIYESDVIDESKILELATLPPKEVLIAKLLGIFKSPLSSLVYDLNYPITKLALALKEIEKKKN